MKKLITLLLVFMLTSTVNIFAANTYEDENGVERLSYTVTPVAGSKVTEIQQVVISFVTDNNLKYSTAKATEGIFNENRENLTPQGVNFALSEDKRSLIITPDSPITTPGTYTVKMSVGSIYEDLGVDYNAHPPVQKRGLECGNIEIQYTVVPPPLVPIENEVSPIIGSTVFNLNTITIPFPEKTTASLGYGYISNGGEKLAAYVNMSNDGRNAIVTCDRDLKAGPATLEFHEGFFKGESGKLSEKISYTWNVVKASLAIEDFHIYKGYTQEITINLTNGIDFSGFQADLTLPADLTVVGDFTLKRGVEGNHMLKSNVLNSGKIRLLCYPKEPVGGTMPNLTGNSGDALVTFTVRASADFDDTDAKIKVDGIVFSTAVGEPYMLQEVEAAVEAREYATEITFKNVPNEVFETGEVTPKDLPFTATVNAGAYNKDIEWSVEQTEPVITFENGIIRAVGVGQATITATALGAAPDKPVTKSCTVTVVYTHATAITIDPDKVNLEVSHETTLVATLSYPENVNYTNKDIVWTSSDDTKVTVDNGKIKALKLTEENNPVIITACIMDVDGKTPVLEARSEVTVKATPATSVTIDPKTATIETDNSFIFKATVNKEATNKNVTWSIDEAYAEYLRLETLINKDTGIAEAKVTALKETETPITITATAADGSGIYDTAIVTVVKTLATNVEVALVEGYDYDTELKHTEFVELKATLTGVTTKPIVWTAVPAENVKIEVDETGIAKVTANATVGKVTVYATVENTSVRGSIDLNIIPTPATEIAINYEGTTKFETGAGQVTLTATVGPNLATDKTYAWTSSDGEIAAVDANGVVTFGEKPGVVTITVKANGAADGQEVKATINFEVVHTFATTIAIDQDPFTFKANETQKLTATTDAATNKTILWTSSNVKVATVDENGKVTAVGVGQATITATIEGTEIADTLVVTVEATPGDVNNDGELDVNDINMLAACILDPDNLPENFVAAAADYNGDGFVNVADIIKLSNDVLITPAEASARMYRTRQYADSSNSLFIEDFTIAEGETKQIAIMLNNNAAFSAFQADIYLPEGLEFVEATLSDRKADHTLASAMRNNGSVRLLSYSLGVNAFAGSEGELVYMTVKATDNFVGDFQIEIDNIKFATVDFAKYYLEPTVTNVAGYTGVESVEDDEIVVKVVGNSIVAPEGAEVYDLNGLRVNAENLAKGIYIVKVGNQVVKVII